MKVQVGDVVHYVAYGTPGGEYKSGDHRAAIVADVLDAEQGKIVAFVINPRGVHFNEAVYDQAGTKPATWHWIEREITHRTLER